MKRVILFSICLILLTACIYDKEAKRLKNSKAVQTEIQSAITEQAKSEYGMNVNVQMKKLSFTYPEGKLMLPLKTDKRLEVPVEVVGTPSYTFKAYIPFYNEEQEQYGFNGDGLDLTELPHMATVLLTDIYQDLYRKELSEIAKFDEGADMSVTVEDKFSSYYFEDKIEEEAIIMDFAKDYNEGEFVDPAKYASLIKKYAELPNEHALRYEEQLKGNQPCTPRINLSIEHGDAEDQTQEERFAALVDFIENNDNLPNGVYFISIREADPEDLSDVEQDYESVLICQD